MGWKRALLMAALTLAVLYIAFLGAYFATSEPSFCAMCHEIKPYTASWGKSSHKEVKCLYCHESRGFVGKLDSKKRGLNYAYQYLTGQYTIVTKALIFEQNCIACHLGDYYNYPKVKRLNFKHYAYIKEDKSCLQCHRNAGHEVNIFTKGKFK